MRDDQALMDDFFATRSFDVVKDWRTCPATFIDPEGVQSSANYADVLKSNDKHEPAGSPKGGQFAHKDTLPAEPGSTSIPMGMIRLYHQTDADNLPSILKDGIRLDKAKGIEGPRAIYADTKGFYGKPGQVPTIEFYVPEDQWQPPFVTADVVPPENIIASHVKWHGHARYILNDPSLLADVVAGKHDDLMDMEGYGPAIKYVKGLHRTRKFNPLHVKAGVTEGGQFAFKEYDMEQEQEAASGLASHFEKYDSQQAKIDVSQKLRDKLWDNKDVQALSQMVMGNDYEDMKLLSDIDRELDNKGTKSLVLNAMGNLIRNWAGTSSDSDAMAHAIQEAVQEEFDLPKTTLKALRGQYVGNDGFEESMSRLNEQLDNKEWFSGGDARAGLRALVRAQYDLTQEEFKKMGITEVTLSRGMKVENKFKEDAYKIYATNAYVSDVKTPNNVVLATVKATHGTANVKGLPVSSWTYNDSVASSFSTSNYGKSPMTTTARIPVKDILSTCLTGFGCMNEGEMVVLGRTRSAQYVAVRAFNSGSDFEDRSQSMSTLVGLTTNNHQPGGGRIGLRQLINSLHNKEAKARSSMNLAAYINFHRNEVATKRAKDQLRQWGYEGFDLL